MLNNKLEKTTIQELEYVLPAERACFQSLPTSHRGKNPSWEPLANGLKRKHHKILLRG